MHTEVDVPNLDHVLVPGMYAEAVLTFERKQEVLSVPLQAINREGDQTTVYLVNQANKIEDRKVALGLQTASDAEVSVGLKEGDQVVVSDRSGLKPGDFVHPQAVEMLRYQGDKEE
jgi:multidrug efflux pump subunit AcrA (membrane-fusion protein)